MKAQETRARTYLATGLAVLNAGAIFLLACRFEASGNLRYGYLGWNLFLAWVPLISAVGLLAWLKNHAWVSWQGIVLSALWLGFLPNSFYLVSDFIHLQATGEVSILFDAVLFMMFAFNGVVLGFVSTRLIHEELIKRFSRRQSWAVICAVLLLSSFAIYLGRVQRWNSWDIILHPAGILLDLSDNLANRSQGVSLLSTMGMFFVLSGVIYVGIYKLVEGVRELPRN